MSEFDKHVLLQGKIGKTLAYRLKYVTAIKTTFRFRLLICNVIG